MSSEWKNRLYNYETQAPQGAWENIAGDLGDAEINKQYPKTLYNAAVSPPKNIWKKIVSHLNDENPDNKVRRIYPFVKYAAAAAVLAFGVWGGVKIITNEKFRALRNTIKN